MRVRNKLLLAPILLLGISFSLIVLGEEGIEGTNSGTFQDPRDGQMYTWVRIGGQIWMAENLRFATESGSWCWENDEANCLELGRFYDWETAQTVAPPGWHLPSDQEWKVLEMTLGLTAEQTDDQGIDRGGDSNTIAEALKKPGSWPTEYEGNSIVVSGESRFAAVPTGFFARGEFTHSGYTGWWSSTASGDKAWNRSLRFFDNKIGRDISSKDHALPVRCVKDTNQVD